MKTTTSISNSLKICRHINELKPIQDVYAQVTDHFNTAPDLLEDLKQFLPESAAQAKVSNVRGDSVYAGSQAQTPRPPRREETH